MRASTRTGQTKYWVRNCSDAGIGRRNTLVGAARGRNGHGILKFRYFYLATHCVRRIKLRGKNWQVAHY